MIDINELRRLAADCYWPTSPVSINELLDRLEAAEKSRDDLLARIEAKETALIDWLYANAPGGWIDNLRVRCDTLRAELKAAHAMALNGVEWRELAQKHESEISAMKRQAPAMWVNSANIVSARINRERGGIGDQHTCTETKTAYHDAPLYALPGAKGE